MINQVTSFEALLLSFAPKFLMKATDHNVYELTKSGASISVVDTGSSSGAMLVPADGALGENSFRLTGNSERSLSLGLIAAHKLAAITIVMVLGNVRGTPGSGSSPKSFTSLVDTSIGPFDIYDGSGGIIRVRFNVSGTYLYANFDKLNLKPSGSILHVTFDGRYASTFVDGVLLATADNGKSGSITYRSDYPIMVGTGSANNNAGDFDIAYFGIFGALSPADIQSQVNGYKVARTLSGTAILDDGQSAAAIAISQWEGLRKCVVTPDVSGAWSVSVPPGDYLLTALGPTGYRPISHGPVTAVTP